MADSLTERCDMTLTLRHAGAATRDYFNCAHRAEFYVAPSVHPSEGYRACAQHTMKAIRRVLSASSDFPVTVTAIGGVR